MLSPSQNFIDNNTPFKYCRCKNELPLILNLLLAFEYFIDPSSQLSNIELGTKSNPFKALDDPFREIFEQAMIATEGKPAGEQMIFIRLKHGSNVTMHTLDMPLVTINSFISIE